MNFETFIERSEAGNEPWRALCHNVKGNMSAGMIPADILEIFHFSTETTFWQEGQGNSSLSYGGCVKLEIVCKNGIFFHLSKKNGLESLRRERGDKNGRRISSEKVAEWIHFN